MLIVCWPKKNYDYATSVVLDYLATSLLALSAVCLTQVDVHRKIFRTHNSLWLSTRCLECHTPNHSLSNSAHVATLLEITEQEDEGEQGSSFKPGKDFIKQMTFHSLYVGNIQFPCGMGSQLAALPNTRKTASL